MKSEKWISLEAKKERKIRNERTVHLSCYGRGDKKIRNTIRSPQNLSATSYRCSTVYLEVIVRYD